jgi:predicted RNA-binding protein YlxR (DUF448 family)
MLNKHIALRTCIGTGEKKDKKEMIRLVKLASGAIVVDLKGKEKGRGASLSLSMDAFDMAIKKNAIQRALKIEKKMTEEEVSKLRNEFEIALNEKLLRGNNKKISLKVSKEEFKKIVEN